MNNGSHVSYPAWRQLNESGALAAVAGYDFEGTVNWRSDTESITLVPLLVTANFFDTLRIPIAHGRGFTAAEAQAERRPHLVVVSHGFWRRHLHSDVAAVGRPLLLNGEAYTVTGVLPEKYRSIAGAGLAPDVYLPLSGDLVPSLDGRHRLSRATRRPPARWTRRRRGSSGARRRGCAHRRGTRSRVHGYPLLRAGGQLLADQVQDLEAVGAFFLVLLVVSALVLAIACANVAGLLLARSLARRREIAMRIALGASRGRLVQQLLTESLVLTAAGAVAGGGLDRDGVRRAVAHAPSTAAPVELQFTLDWRTVSLAFGLVAFSTCVTGLVPALQATRPALLPAIKLDDRVVPTRRFTMRGLLVAGQVAVSMLLLVAALLFVRSLGTAMSVNPGFDIDPVLVARLSFVEGRQGSTDHQAVEDIAQRIRAIPGVASAAFAEGVPLTMAAGSRTGTDLSIDGRDAPVRVEYSSNQVGRTTSRRWASGWCRGGTSRRRIGVGRVGDHHQRGIRAPLLRGPESDRPAHPSAAAQRCWPRSHRRGIERQVPNAWPKIRRRLFTSRSCEAVRSDRRTCSFARRARRTRSIPAVRNAVLSLDGSTAVT